MSAFRAGVLTLVVILVAAYFGFTKSNPFANPYERPRRREPQARLAGARGRGEVAGLGRGGRRSRAREQDHDGAARGRAAGARGRARQVRPRILLEGNFFVDLEPGSSQAERSRTAAPCRSPRPAAR